MRQPIRTYKYINNTDTIYAFRPAVYYPTAAVTYTAEVCGGAKELRRSFTAAYGRMEGTTTTTTGAEMP